MLDRWIPVKDFIARYPDLGWSKATVLRWIRDDHKGFSRCGRKPGLEWLINSDEVEKWLEEQQAHQPVAH
jgi:excisionase family DNA binding protein